MRPTAQRSPENGQALGGQLPPGPFLNWRQPEGSWVFLEISDLSLRTQDTSQWPTHLLAQAKVNAEEPHNLSGPCGLRALNAL